MTPEKGKRLLVHRDTVRPEWIDYNGHMNVAFYVLAFDHAADALFDAFGMDDAYRRANDVSTFALESHVCYLKELHADEALRFEIQLLDRTDKFFHYISLMFRESDDTLCATAEWISTHMDMSVRRPAPFLPEIEAKLDAIWEAHKDMPWPDQAGRKIGIRRK